MKVYIPDDVKFIIDELEKSKFEAYIVGGCVRDSILGKIPNDWDVTTSALPSDMKRIFKKTFDTGIEHGTVTVVINKKNYEVTTFRIDGEYEDLRHPKKVEFSNYLQDDLSRRDFTINAMAYSEKNGLVDLFDGIKDLELRMIRCVNSPKKRFMEDALRILRAVRFAVVLNFSLEENTKKYAMDLSETLNYISKERIREEFNKIIICDNINKFDILVETNILKEIYEPLTKLDFKILKEYFLKLGKNKDLELKLALILHKMENPKEYFSYLKYDNFTRDNVINILFQVENLYKNYEKIDLYFLRKHLSKYGIFNYEKVLKLLEVIYEIDVLELYNKYLLILNNKDPLVIKDLDIKGNELKEMGIKEGKRIGEILNMLLDEVHKEPEKNSNSVLKNIVRSIL